MNETKTLPTINSIYIPSDGKKKKKKEREREVVMYLVNYTRPS